MVSGEKGGIAELIQALDQATLMAKQLPVTADSSQLQQIYSSLHSAHQHLSLFLSQSQPHQHPPPPVPENSLSSAVAGEPMQLGDDDDDVNETSKTSVDRVEERMRDCFIQNKRPKRPLSPVSAAADLRYDNDGPDFEFDPHGTKLRSLDLIYQFHS